MNIIDNKIIKQLMQNGRSTWAEMAAMLDMSPPGVADKVRRLEEGNVISGYHAHVNPAKLGLSLTAFIKVTLDQPASRTAFLELVETLAEIQACYHVAGDHDYLLLVRCRDTTALESLLTDHIKAIPGIVRTNTTIVLSTVKETAVLPLENNEL
jgi:Lrp/AsnC family leucine-responsive transcriptional regulator